MHERVKMRRARQSKKPRTHVKPVVGTLVWIRRRNGSWWPGRIISPDELSSSHIMSQRSGTPVKLLGREDASVDWYNVEKSKRVKAFRCGEFDECIETAKALGGVSGKRREKYARREDAILDAIELEKKQLELMAYFSETCSPDRNTKSTLKQEKLDGVVTSIMSESSFDLVSMNEAGITIKSLHKQGRINAGGPDIDLEDEGTGSTPRMKGLHDLGMISCCTNTKKLESNAVLNGGCEGSVLSEACARRSPGNGATSHTSKNFSPWSKKKLTPNRCWEDGSLKRRDRRKPLTQVLESMTKLTMPVIINGKLDKCENPYLVPPKVRGTLDASFQPSLGCGPVASAVAIDTCSQENAIKLKDEYITENHKFGCLGPSKLEAGTACLISTSACPVALECTAVRRRKLSCLSSGEKVSLISSSLCAPISRPSTFVTSACTSASAMDCLSQHDNHFCKAMNGVSKQSSCFACSSRLGRGCEKPLSSKNTNRLGFSRRIDGLNLMNGAQPMHKAVLHSDSSYTKLKGGQTLSSKCCSSDKSDNLLEDEILLSNSSQTKEQELLNTIKHQDTTQLFLGVSETMKNKIKEISNTYMVKPMKPPLNKCSTKCICCQGGPYSGVCKRPKLGIQSTFKGRTEVCPYEELEPVLESREHAEGQKKTWARVIGSGVIVQSDSTSKEGRDPVEEHDSSSLAQVQSDVNNEKLGVAEYGVTKKICLVGSKDDLVSSMCQGSSENALLYAQPPSNALHMMENNKFDDAIEVGPSTPDLGKGHCKFCQGKGSLQANSIFNMTEDALNCQGSARLMVSLFSGVTGRDVVGYAVQVEVLDRVVSAGTPVDILHPVWRTARRTARQRVPRSCTGRAIQYSRSCSEQDEELKHQVTLLGVSTQSYSSIYRQNSLSYASTGGAGLRRGILPSKACSRLDKESLSKKLLRRACLSSKRTRVLSSIAEGKLGNESLDGGMHAPSRVMQSVDEDARKVFVNRAIPDSELENFESRSELVPFTDATHITSLPFFSPTSQKEVATCIPVSVAFSRLKAVVCV